jgi:hypothetical protein
MTQISHNNKKGHKFSTIKPSVSLIRSNKRHYLHLVPSLLISSNILPSVLALLSDLLAVLVQQERNRNECNTQEAQQTASPVDAQAVVHGARKQREASTKSTSHEIVASQYTGDIVGIGVTEIWQHCVEERESCDTEECGSNNPRLRQRWLQ